MRRPGGLSIAVTATLLVACGRGDLTETTTATADVTPPDQVAMLVMEGVRVGDPISAADWTVLEQMPWLAMAEGASIQQAAAVLDEGTRQVAINYWKGFSEGSGLPGLEIGGVDEADVGSYRFATVTFGPGIGSRNELRLVLRLEDQWRVDLIASFGAALAQRLRDALDIIAANRGPDAERLAELISNQRDSVLIASESDNLNQPSRQALEDLAGAIELLRR